MFVTLTGLYVWAQRRAQAIRKQSAKREQSAMALMLAGGGAVEGETEDTAEEPIVKRKVIGRLLEDDPAEKAAAAARHAAAARDSASGKARRELPPLEYRQAKSHRTGQRDEAHNGSHRSTAADDLDPIEDLISQIMVHEPSPPSRSQSATPVAAPARSSGPADGKRDLMMPSSVPLRELVLAWYESRGYRRSPASPAVWPIELVLRHREDATRAYAFVVQNDHVSVDRITALIEQAREIGMMRVAVIAEAGYERGAKEVAKRRHVRLIDRSTMEAELSELQLPTAAKIIAVARTRSAAESPAA